jgi:DNA topoisomerase-6 subunit B
MLSDTKARTLLQFLEREFSRVGRKTALGIIERAGSGLSARSYPTRIAHSQATRLYRAISRTKISKPHTDCLVPIGEDRLLEGLRKELDADFFLVMTRPPSVYNGNPFQVEVGIAWGRPGAAALAIDPQGRIRRKRKGRTVHDSAERAPRGDEPAHVLRFANRVPLLYQQSACVITKAIAQTNWRLYGLKQPKGSLPLAPMVVTAHVASVWVPFTSESKEAVAPVPEILRELMLALQQAGRRLATRIRSDERLEREYARRVYIERYLPHIGVALQDILELSDRERDRAVARLDAILHKSRRP